MIVAGGDPVQRRAPALPQPAHARPIPGAYTSMSRSPFCKPVASRDDSVVEQKLGRVFLYPTAWEEALLF